MKLVKKVKIKFNEDKTAAYLTLNKHEYKVTVGTYEGEGLRIWIDDYNPDNEVTVNIEWEHERLINPLNKKTERGAVVERAIQIHEELKHINYRFSYF